MGDATRGSPVPLQALISSPLGSYQFPSRLLSNHKILYENHSIAVYPLALLGTTISVSLSRAPLIPPRRISDSAFLFVSGRSLAAGIVLCTPGSRACQIC